MTLFEAALYGLVQGLTEFLPISSTAHLRLLPELLGKPDPGAAFTAILQLGTTAAVLLYFWGDIWRIAGAFFSALGRRRPFESFDARLGWYLIVGTVPIGIAGLVLKDAIETSFRALWVVAAALILFALLLLAAERLARHARAFDSARLGDALAIGAAQCLALIPGASRSGVTLTAGLALGFKRADAARLSFLLSIPATVAAGLFELRHLSGPAPHEAVDAVGAPLWGPSLIVGLVVAFIFGYLSIAALLALLRTRTTIPFVIYRLALGSALFVAIFTH